MHAKSFGEPTPLLAERYISSFPCVADFSESVHLDWFAPTFMEYHMQLHVGCTIFEVVRSFVKVDALANVIVRFQTPLIRYYVRLHVDEYLQMVRKNLLKCYVLQHGCQGLGGFFIGKNPLRNAIVLGHPFLRREHLHSSYAVELLAQFCRQVRLYRLRC